jgi:hypothetical protein
MVVRLSYDIAFELPKREEWSNKLLNVRASR